MSHDYSLMVLAVHHLNRAGRLDGCLSQIVDSRRVNLQVSNGVAHKREIIDS